MIDCRLAPCLVGKAASYFCSVRGGMASLSVCCVSFADMARFLFLVPQRKRVVRLRELSRQRVILLGRWPGTTAEDLCFPDVNPPNPLQRQAIFNNRLETI